MCNERTTDADGLSQPNDRELLKKFFLILIDGKMFFVFGFWFRCFAFSKRNEIFTSSTSRLLSAKHIQEYSTPCWRAFYGIIPKEGGNGALPEKATVFLFSRALLRARSNSTCHSAMSVVCPVVYLSVGGRTPPPKYVFWAAQVILSNFHFQIFFFSKFFFTQNIFSSKISPPKIFSHFHFCMHFWMFYAILSAQISPQNCSG